MPTEKRQQLFNRLLGWKVSWEGLLKSRKKFDIKLRDVEAESGLPLMHLDISLV